MGEELELKACPRCRGDVYGARDRYGEYKECLQCGYVEYVNPVRADYPRQDVGRTARLRTKRGPKRSAA